MDPQYAYLRPGSVHTASETVCAGSSKLQDGHSKSENMERSLLLRQNAKFSSSSAIVLTIEKVGQDQVAMKTTTEFETARIFNGETGTTGWCRRCFSIDWERALAEFVVPKRVPKGFKTTTQGLYIDNNSHRIGRRDEEYRILATFPMSQVAVDPACPLCNGLNGLMKGIVDVSSNDTLGLVARGRTLVSGQPRIVAVPMGARLSDLGQYPKSEKKIISGYLEDCVSRAKSINLRSFDTSLLTTWLDTCRASHSCCNEEPNIPELRLVQCSTRIVVLSHGEERYAALSYVWGSAAPGEELDGQGRLPRSVGQTIEDAITIARCMGLMYLWIDRYCILEDDKKRQINLMDKIYGNATVTIIAAAGENPGYGLPGVSSRKQTLQMASFHIGTRWEAFALHRDKDLLIRSSKWSERGWTYQEAVLSPRRLIFTDEMCVWHCSKLCVCDAVQNIHSVPFDDLKIEMVWDHIIKYRGRKLSYAADKVDAISGTLNRIQELYLDRFRHIQGQPIIKEVDENTSWSQAFFRALCWTEGYDRKNALATRVACFPSWSWTGWAGSDLYHPGIAKSASSELWVDSKSDVCIELMVGSSWIVADDFFQTRTADHHGTPNSHRLEWAPIASIELLRITTAVFPVTIRPCTKDDVPEQHSTYTMLSAVQGEIWLAIQFSQDASEQILFDFHLAIELRPRAEPDVIGSRGGLVAPFREPIAASSPLTCKALLYDWEGSRKRQDQWVLLVSWVESRQCWERIAPAKPMRLDLLSASYEIESIIIG